jgi:hypothetical protein
LVQPSLAKLSGKNLAWPPWGQDPNIHIRMGGSSHFTEWCNSYLFKIAIASNSDKYLLFARLWNHHLMEQGILDTNAGKQLP